MNRLLQSSFAVIAAIASAGAAHASNDKAVGDKAAGKALVYTCHGCHGVEGYANAYPNYPVPKIAGQNAQYVITALHAYQAGERKHPTMMAQAQSLSDKDINDIAAYLSGLAK